VLADIPQLGLHPGDIILRYMYRGEGFADIWAGGKWYREYDCSFVTEKDGAGCGTNCAARVASEGNKSWWVQVKTADGTTGWTYAKGHFDCMDALSGDKKCENLQKP